MNNTKLLTIVVPTFNRYSELEETLICLLTQIKMNNLYDIVNFVVADNASEGDLPKSLEEVIVSNNFQYFKNPSNIGITKNLLKSLEFVTTKYVWFFGDDDFVDNLLIQKLLSLLNSNYDFIQINRLSFYDKKEIEKLPLKEVNIKPVSFSNATVQDIEKDSGFITSNIINVELLRNSLLILKSKPKQLSLNNNYYIKALNLTAIISGKKYVRITTQLVYQKISNASHFHQTPELIYKTFFKDAIEVFNFIHSNHPNFPDLKKKYLSGSTINIVILRIFHPNSEKIGKEILQMYDRPSFFNRFLCLSPKSVILILYRIYKLIKKSPYPIQFEKFSKSLSN